jgi:hypothetical protein
LRQPSVAHPAQLIAKYSYGIYLLHVPALIFVMRFLPALPLTLKIAAFLALTALLSVACFHAIEHPLIQLGKHLTQPPRRSLAPSNAALPSPVALPGSIAARRPGLTALSTASPAAALGASAERQSMPLVSIITPVYNAAPWLRETMASVRAQTLTDWEQIMVDDGSSDNSVAIAEAAALEDSRFRLIRTPRNMGPSAARNLAIEAARGRFIAFLDADDLWLPEKLARSIAWITSGGYSFIYHDYRHMSHDGLRVGALIKAPEKLDWRTLHTRRGTGGCVSIVIDRKRIPVFSFPPIAPYRAEDFCLWAQIIREGHIGHRLPVDLACYRLSRTSRSANKLVGAINAWHLYREVSMLPIPLAAFWWLQYAWSALTLYHRARPREWRA